MNENIDPSDVKINVADLANAVNIIDYAASKGNFTGPDLELVGRTRNRIHAFVDAHMPKQEENKENAKDESVIDESPVKTKKTTSRKKKA